MDSKKTARRLLTRESKLEQLHNRLEQAEAVIIGAGAGLSVAAGFTYNGKRFYEHFQDFADRYQFHDMYTGGFYPYDTLEEYWAYWSRYIKINRYQKPEKPVYEKLLEIIKRKDYFVLTTNVDHCFQKSGFHKERLFYTQGDYGLFQCSEPCQQKTYENEEKVQQMAAQQKEMKIPSALIPYCPICGKPMSMNLRSDNTFVEDEGWHQAAERYSEFLRLHQDMKVLFLELGTGYNTPAIIKYPFWQMTAQWTNATYACINLGEAFAPEEIEQKSICINADIEEVLKLL